MDWAFARKGLSRWLRGKRELASAERRFVAEVVFGIVRHLRRIDEGLRLGGAAPGSSRDSVRVLLYLVLEQGLSLADAARCAQEEGGQWIDWQLAGKVDSVLAGHADPVKQLALSYSVPDWLAREWCTSFGDKAPHVAAGFGQRAPLTLRVSARRTSRAEAMKALEEVNIDCRPGQFAAHAIVLSGWPNVNSLTGIQQGLLEVQDEASQLVAELVGVRANQVVVDMCAGAGGKTLALADWMGNRGRIVAVDVDVQKLAELRRRVRRARISNVQCVVLDEDGWSGALEKLVGTVDRVLVDAPCSGLGAMRRHPEVKWRVRSEDIPSFANKQLAITRRAASLLAPGGRLVYATCTVLPQENVQVVEKVVGESGLSILPIGKVVGPSLAEKIGDVSGRFLQMWPHMHGTDGFFAAVLEHTGEKLIFSGE